MSTLSMRYAPSLTSARRAPAPIFGAATLRAYARYLATREGIDHYEFVSADNLPDVMAARSFAEELRRQIGPFLTNVITVEQRNSKVLVVLRDGFQPGK